MMELNFNSKLGKRPGLFEKTVKDGLYLTTPDGSEHYLNSTASLIWNMIDGEICLASIVVNLSGKFPNTGVEVIQQYSYKLVEDFFKYSLVTLDGNIVSGSSLEEIDYKKDRDLYVKLLFNYAQASIEKCIPIKMVLEVTHCCNVKCKYCYANTSAAGSSPGLLTTNKIYSVLDQASELGVFKLTVTGGEPFMRPDLFDILSYAEKLNMFIRVQSNGTLITEKHALKFSEMKAAALDITLLGAEEKTHDMLVGSKGAFQKSCQAIKNLRKLGVPVTIKFVINKYNYDEAESIMTLAEELNVDRVNRTALIYPRFNGDVDTLGLRVSDDQLHALAKKAIYIPHPDPCGAGRNKFTVSPYGEIYACQFVRHPVGNLRDQDLKSIWNSPEMEYSREEKKYERPPVCLSCGVKDTCSRCPAIAYHEDGDIKGLSREACRIAHIAATHKQVLNQ
jgi:radical SAM protein with 4Fe4S-binding SPASM domain